MIKGVVRGRLQPFFSKNGYSQQAPMSDWTLEAPRHAAFGHFATNIAFDLAKRLKRSPQQIASEMSDQLNADPLVSTWASAQAVSGFVNLTLSDVFICESFFALVHHKPKFPRVDGKMLLEYVSANPTGPLHIGHGRWAVIGSVMADLLRYIGADLSTEFYINDAGSQVQKLYASVNAMRKDQPVPEDGYHGHYIRDLAQMSADPVAVILAGQRAVLDKLGVRFDNWFSEKSLYGDALVDRAIVALRKKELAYDLNGAVWFKSTSFGDD
jgi:arginyl-tRNA synthetase